MQRILRVVLCALCFGLSATQAAEPALTVFAAASLTDVLQQAGVAYTASSGQAVRFSFAASSALARQIESGAPADVFVSADQDWMDYLQTRQLIQAATRADVVTNTLVLVAAADSKLSLTIAPGFALAAALGPKGRLSIGDPASVPAGKYAQAALTQLRVWPGVAGRIVAADNVRTALNFVARGEAPLGVVYGTDALAEPKVRVVAVFPAGSHAPIRYPAALTRNASTNAAGFLRFLQSDRARAIFAKAGFAKPQTE